MLELSNIQKAFHASPVVRGVSLSIQGGEFFSLLGASGCGKTTILRLIAGLESLDEGLIHLDGFRLDSLPPHQRPVHTVFQRYALFPHLNVFENVAFGLRLKKVSPSLLKKQVGDMLDLVQMGTTAHRAVTTLSGGQQQRVALARALVNQPRVLLLDEPLSALDMQLRLSMQRELRSLQREVGITFVYVTHDQEEALSLSDRIAVMREGRVLQVGPPQEVYGHPNHPYVASFLGGVNDFTEPQEPQKDCVLVRPEHTVWSVLKPSGDWCGRPAKICQIAFKGQWIELQARHPENSVQQWLVAIPATLGTTLPLVGESGWLTWLKTHQMIFTVEHAGVRT